MVLFGTYVNVILIIIGSLTGLVFVKIKESSKETAMKGISLVIILIGFKMALDTKDITVVLISILIGTLIGEALRLEYMMNKAGDKVSHLFGSVFKDESNIAQGFITATLLFCVGAMAIIGSLNSGINQNHEILITKSLLDGFTAFVLTTTLGYSVIFSAIPVLLYQSLITLLATKIDRMIPEVIFNDVITEVATVGGIMIVAIGLNLLKLTKIKVTNLLPALFVVILVIYIKSHFSF